MFGAQWVSTVPCTRGWPGATILDTNENPHVEGDYQWGCR